MQKSSSGPAGRISPSPERASPHSSGRGLITLLPKAFIAALLVGAILILLAGVFLRYVWVQIADYFDWPSIGFFWVEEAGEFALAWLTLIGGAVAIVERTHFALEFLVHRFPPPARAQLDRVLHLLIAAFGVCVAVWGWGLSATNVGLTSPGLEINLAWLYGASVVGGALMAVYGLSVAFGFVRIRHDQLQGP